MFSLSSLKNTHRTKKVSKRVGRGPGSKLGKTCGRGQKGEGARSGSKARYTYEGGQFRLFQKLPTRGFSNARFKKTLDCVNLGQINFMYEDGDVVNIETLKRCGFLSGKSNGLKILNNGTLNKKVKIEALKFSKSAEKQLQELGIEYTIMAS